MIENKNIPLSMLIVNPKNDRHGILTSEHEAVNWLLENKKDFMRALAKDIAQQKRVYEAPLVKPNENGKYIVFDGNRRVACLKLLLGLFDDYEFEDIDYYKKIRTEYDCLEKIQLEIPCDISTNQDEIDTIILRRHAPKNKGERQLRWGTEEKHNFLSRTGHKKDDFAAIVQAELRKHGYLTDKEKINFSTFNRLFSSAAFQERSGVKLKDGQLEYLISDKDKVLAALAHIANEMNEGRITLHDIWKNTDKTDVLDRLESDGVLPNANDRHSHRKEQKNLENPSLDFEKNERKSPNKLSRYHLLPEHLIVPQHNKNCPAKIRNLFIELQSKLNLRSESIAISICFRVLIELLTHAYAKKHEIEFQKDERLSSKICRVYRTLPAKFQTDNDTFIKNLSQKNNYFSTGTLNAFVHSTDSIPIAADLISFADNFEKYISALVEDLNSQQ